MKNITTTICLVLSYLSAVVLGFVVYAHIECGFCWELAVGYFVAIADVVGWKLYGDTKLRESAEEHKH